MKKLRSLFFSTQIGPSARDVHSSGNIHEDKEVQKWLLDGQQKAWDGDYFASINSLIKAARIDAMYPAVAESIRNVLSADGLKVSDDVADELLSLYPDDDFLKEHLHSIVNRLDLSGPHVQEGREQLSARLVELTDAELVDETGDRFNASDSFLGPYFFEAFRRHTQGNLKDDGLQGTSAYGSDLLNAAARILKKAEFDRDLSHDLATLIANDEQVSLLQALLYLHDKSGSRRSKADAYPGRHFLAQAIVMQGRNALRYLGKVDAAKQVLAHHANETPNDWRAQYEYGQACIRQPNGVNDATTLRASFMGTDFDAKAGLHHVERAIELRPNDPTLKSQLRAARRAAIPPLIFVGFPRSASVFVYTSLADGLKKPSFGGVQGGAFPDFTIAQAGLNVLLAGRGTAHTHLRASQTNLLELSDRYGIDKMLVHVRDPRQAMLSWHYFLPKIMGNLDPVQSKHYGLPEYYPAMSSDAQMNWLIENWLSVLVNWLEEWRQAAQSDTFHTEIYFSRFEDLHHDQQKFFSDILEFFDIDLDLFDPPTAPTRQGDRNFRLGELESWKTTLSSEQQESVSKMIPNDLLSFFKWQDFPACDR